MPRSRASYPAAFRHQMIDLVRAAGRSPEALAKEFERTAQSIRNWVKQDDLDQGRREVGLTTEERTELRASGVRAGRKRVARPMRTAAISGVSRRRAVRTTWRSDQGRTTPTWSTGTSPRLPGTGCG